MSETMNKNGAGLVLAGVLAAEVSGVLADMAGRRAVAAAMALVALMAFMVGVTLLVLGGGIS